MLGGGTPTPMGRGGWWAGLRLGQVRLGRGKLYGGGLCGPAGPCLGGAKKQKKREAKLQSTASSTRDGKRRGGTQRDSPRICAHVRCGLGLRGAWIARRAGDRANRTVLAPANPLDSRAVRPAGCAAAARPAGVGSPSSAFSSRVLTSVSSISRRCGAACVLAAHANGRQQQKQQKQIRGHPVRCHERDRAPGNSPSTCSCM